MTIQQKFFGFHGRLTRQEYWELGVLLMLGGLCINFAAATLFGFDPTLIVTGLLFWPSTAVAVKRGHDRNRPTVWIVLVQVAGAIAGIAPIFDPSLAAARLLLLPVWLYLLIDFLILDGTAGPNRYGPSPKDLKAAA